MTSMLAGRVTYMHDAWLLSVSSVRLARGARRAWVMCTSLATSTLSRCGSLLWCSRSKLQSITVRCVTLSSRWKGSS